MRGTMDTMADNAHRVVLPDDTGGGAGGWNTGGGHGGDVPGDTGGGFRGDTNGGFGGDTGGGIEVVGCTLRAAHVLRSEGSPWREGKENKQLGACVLEVAYQVRFAIRGGKGIQQGGGNFSVAEEGRRMFLRSAGSPWRGGKENKELGACVLEVAYQVRFAIRGGKGIPHGAPNFVVEEEERRMCCGARGRHGEREWKTAGRNWGLVCWRWLTRCAEGEGGGGQRIPNLFYEKG
jgi:hypothetical protein